MTAVKSLDNDMRAAVLVALRELELDPHFVNIGGRDWLNSRAVVSLKKAGYDIHRLKGKETRDLRIFYFIDETSRQVLGKEIVPRRDDAETYGSGDHIMRIKQNYFEYFHSGRRR